jgi:hypothetical protein
MREVGWEGTEAAARKCCSRGIIDWETCSTVRSTVLHTQ